MARTVISSRDLAVKATFAPGVGAAAADGYLDRLIKYVPAEVIALYMTVMKACEAAGAANWLLWVVFGIVAVLAVFYLVRILHINKPLQILVTILAYGIWAFALGGPFSKIPNRELISAISVPIYTFLIAIVEA